MPGPNQTSNGHAPKFQLVSKSSYPELQAILKKRLPIAVQLHNAVQLALTGDNSDFEYYTYNGILNAQCIVVGHGTMKTKETDAGTMLTYLSVPKPGESVTQEFANDLVSQFTRPDRNLSYGVERSSSPFVVQALMNQGHVLEVRACGIVCMKENFSQPTIPLPENCILKKLEPEDAHIVVSHWKYGLWDRPEYYTQKCIERNPSAGIYSTETGELMSWVICYNFGSIGMLFTPEKYRGKGLGKIVMQHVSEAFWARGLIPCTGVEPRNVISGKIMSQLGFETTHAVDFLFTS